MVHQSNSRFHFPNAFLGRLSLFHIGTLRCFLVIAAAPNPVNKQ